jgi:hypothetical protein
MFGVGTYLSVNFSKSDLYSDTNAPRRQKRKMFIVRVLMGKFHTAKEKSTNLTTPPDSADEPKHPFDSVYGATREEGGCVDHPEIIIYKDTQLLPLYLVTYQHEDGCPCALCHRRPARP